MKSSLVLSFALLLFVNAASSLYIISRQDPAEPQQPSAKDEFERLVLLCLQHPPPPPPPDASPADESSAPGEVPPAEAQLREMIYRALERQGGPAGPSGQKDYKKKMGRILKGLVKCVMSGGPPQVQPPAATLPPPVEKRWARGKALLEELQRVSAPVDKRWARGKALLEALLRVSAPGEAGAIPEQPTPGQAVSELVIFCVGALENKSVLPEEGRRALMLRWARQPEDVEDELEKLVKKLVKCVQKKGEFGKQKGGKTQSSSNQD